MSFANLSFEVVFFSTLSYQYRQNCFNFDFIYCTPLSLHCSIFYPDYVSIIFSVNITRFAFSPFVFYSVFNVQIAKNICFLLWKNQQVDSSYRQNIFVLTLVGSSGLEPPTSRLSGARSSLLSYEPVSCSCLFLLPIADFLLHGGDEEIRTLDPLLAGQVLSQLSYTPGSFQGLTDPENRTTKYFT